MQIDESYYIETDSFNYVLLKEESTGEVNPDTGKEIISRDQWYYPTMQDALRGYVKHALKPLPEDVGEVLKRLERINNNIYESITKN